MVGRTLTEGVIHTELSSLADGAMESRRPSAQEIVLPFPTERTVSVYCAPIIKDADAGVPPDGLLVVLHDLTEIDRLNRSRRDFVANASHELRTPLTTLRAMAETIQLHAKEDPSTHEEFADKIVTEVARLSTLVDDLLSPAEIEEGKRWLSKKRIPVS